jgi:hypothetical protein
LDALVRRFLFPGIYFPRNLYCKNNLLSSLAMSIITAQVIEAAFSRVPPCFKYAVILSSK